MVDIEGFHGFQLVRRGGLTLQLVTELPEPSGRTAFLVEPVEEAVILGSTQPLMEDQLLRLTKGGVPFVRRGSGGGGVVVNRDDVFWLDLFLPADDPLFDHDVRAGSLWVGALWQRLFAEMGVGSTKVHSEALVSNEWSRSCCFLGRGPGELFMNERKVVGLSQRRIRAGAWFFSLAYRQLDARRHAMLLASQDDEATGLAEALERGADIVDRSALDFAAAVEAVLDL
jgi:lipoate-protein ligase A